MIEIIVLDLDGPVLEGKYRHYQCYRDILIENNYIPLSIEQYWEMKRNRIDRHRILGKSNADDMYDLFLRSWLERIEEKRYLALDVLQPGVLQKLYEWKSSGIRLIMATMRNNLENLRWQLDSLSLSVFFEQVIAVKTSQKEKGKAENVKAFLDGSGKDSVLWVGDTEVDIDAARILGVKVCAVGSGLRTIDYLATLKPDYVSRYLCELDLLKMELK